MPKVLQKVLLTFTSLHARAYSLAHIDIEAYSYFAVCCRTREEAVLRATVPLQEGTTMTRLHPWVWASSGALHRPIRRQRQNVGTSRNSLRLTLRASWEKSRKKMKYLPIYQIPTLNWIIFLQK